MPPSPRHRLLLPAALALALLAIVLASLFARGYSPGSAQLGGAFMDLDWDHVDYNNHLWNLWDFRRIYLGEATLAHTDSEFYPRGLRTIAAQGDLLLKALGGLLALVFSPHATFFLLGLLVLLGNGLGGLVLVRQVTGSTLAGVVAALAFCFSGAAAWALNTGNLEYGLWLWLCLYLTYLVRLLRHGRLRDALPGAVFGACAVLTNYVFFFHVVLFSLALVAFEARRLDRGKLRALAALALGAALLLAPAALSFRQGAEELALSYRLPGAEGASLERRAEVPYNNRARAADYLPLRPARHRQDAATLLTCALLMGLALVTDRRRAAPWVTAWALFLALSLGPYLLLGEGKDQTVVPLPFALPFQLVPMYHYIRFPHRVATFVTLAMGVGAGLGAAWLEAQLRGARRTLRLLVPALVLLEAAALWPVQVTSRAPVNPFYRRLAADPGRFALVELPLDFGILDARYLYFQTYHGKPLFNGAMPRYLGTRAIPNWDMVNQNPLLRALYAAQSPLLLRFELSKYIPLAPQGERPAISLGQLRAGARDLAKLGFRYVLLHRKVTWDPVHVLALPAENEPEQLLRWALGEPVYSDEELAAFPLTRGASVAE